MAHLDVEEVASAADVAPDHLMDADPARREGYRPPMVTSFGAVLEPIQIVGDGLSVRLMPPFFLLPTELREPVLGMLLDHRRQSYPECHVFFLYDATGEKRLGIYSDHGLELNER